MKKSIYMVLLMVSFSLQMALAQRTLDLDNGTWLSTAEAPSVTRTLTPTQNGYQVKYQFHKALVMPDEIFPDKDVWYLENFNVNNVPGEPAYPYASDSFSVPYGHTASMTVVEEDWYTVESIVAPGRAPRLLSDTTTVTPQNVPALKVRQGWFPATTAADNGVNVYRDIDIFNVGITPVQFDLSNGTARICRTLTYEVTFQEGDPILFAGRSSSDVTAQARDSYADDSYLSATTLNWALEKESDARRANSGGSILPGGFNYAPVYLIISTPTYNTALQSFADWKRTLGYDVVISTASSWTNETIKAEITRIKNLHPNLSYLLIVGNNQQVPAEKVNASTGVFTYTALSDLQYALTAKTASNPNCDFIPDVKYGRISANNSTEAERVFSKIISYEKNAPASSDAFYSNPLFLSTFLDKTNPKDGTADMRNCQTSYEIAENLRKIGKSPTIEFLAGPNENPLKWGEPGWVTLQDGSEVLDGTPDIPAKMRKPTYKWDVTVPRIKQHLNNGTGQLYYFAHGSKSGWQDMLDTSNLTGLSNGSKLPVCFSMACETGDFTTSGCFAEKMLTYQNGGVAAMYAFTEPTYVSYTDVIAASFYNGMYPNLNYSPYLSLSHDKISIHPSLDNNSVITELGALDCFAKTMVANSFPNNEYNQGYKKYEIAMLTLFGDPSMHIYLNKPTQVQASASIQNGKLYVTVPDGVTVSVYNKATNSVINKKGSVSGLSLPSDYSTIIVSAHLPGSLPYVVDLNKLSPKREAAASPEIVREDRIWTYYQEFNGQMDPSDDIYVNVRFSGTTEIDGKTYHNCYAWKDGTEFSESDAPVIAYMREEDGKVYAYYHYMDDPSILQNVLDKYGIDMMPDCPVTFAWTDTPDRNYERLLFDFNLKEGDELWFNRDELDTDKGYMILEGINDIEFEGENVTEYKYRNGIWDYNVFRGLGSPVGLLPFPGAMPLCYCKTGYNLVRVTDLEKDILFATPLSVDDVAESAEVLESRYYDLQGRSLNGPTDGVYVKVDIFADGHRKVKKHVK